MYVKPVKFSFMPQQICLIICQFIFRTAQLLRNLIFIKYFYLFSIFLFSLLVSIVQKTPRFWNNNIALVSPRRCIEFIKLSSLRGMKPYCYHVTDVIQVSLLSMKGPLSCLFSFQHIKTFRLSTSLFMRLFSDLSLLANLLCA